MAGGFKNKVKGKWVRSLFHCTELYNSRSSKCQNSINHKKSSKSKQYVLFISSIEPLQFYHSGISISFAGSFRMFIWGWENNLESSSSIIDFYVAYCKAPLLPYNLTQRIQCKLSCLSNFAEQLSFLTFYTPWILRTGSERTSNSNSVRTGTVLVLMFVETEARALKNTSAATR